MFKTCINAFAGGAYGGTLTINLDAVKYNYRLLHDKVYPAHAAAVVKANAYGLGAEHIAPAFYQAGCRLFFVAQLIEAYHLRSVVPQDAAIAILNDIQPALAREVADNGFWPVLNSLLSIDEWQQECCRRGQKLPCLLQVDTGMSRLGLDRQEIATLSAKPDIFSVADIRYIISHLACADECQARQNLMQYERFCEILAVLPPRPAALANSGGIFLGDWPLSKFDMVRPGLALYGVHPHKYDADMATWLRPVVELSARVVQTRHVKAGDRVGYGGVYQAGCDMSVATIAVGYADGLPRSLEGKGAAFYQDVRLPMIGRISMDSITLDISALAKDSLKRGDEVELIGQHQSISHLAQDAGTIAYEMFTSLGHRYERHYIESEDAS